MSQLPPDYHTHCELCKHAEGRPSDYIKAARAGGIEQIAATDHCPTPHQYDPEHRMEIDQFAKYREWIEDARMSNPDRVLFGVEADFYSGCISFLDEFFHEHPLDIVIGSVHFQSYWAHQESERGLFDKEDLKWVYKRYYKLVGLMVESGQYDVVSHFDLPKKRGGKLPHEEQHDMVRPILDKVKKAGMAIEINTSGLIHEAKEIYPSPEILSLAHEREIPITFGSDAHTPDRVGANFKEAVALAKEIGYTHYNTYKQRTATPVPLA